MPTAVTPFLMFEDQQAEEAMNFYVKTIPDSEVLNVQRHGPEGPGPEGSIFVASFSLRGLPVMVSDTYISHDFTFTPSISLFVTCESEEEIVEFSSAFSEGGKYLMPLDNYGFSRRFAWVVDRFGVSWQLNLP